MSILPATSSSARIEKAHQCLFSLTDSDDIQEIMSIFGALHQELKPVEEKAVKNHEHIERLWSKAIQLDSPHLLLSLIRAQWTPLLKVHYPTLGLEQPLSWGWIAFHQKANHCFAFLMKNKEIQQGFLKDAQITPVVETLLWNDFGPAHWELPAQLTPLFKQKLFEGNSMLHLLTNHRLWEEYELAEEGVVSYKQLTWIEWVEKYGLHLLDEKNPQDKTAFESDSPSEQKILTALRSTLEKARFSSTFEITEKISTIKPKRL